MESGRHCKSFRSISSKIYSLSNSTLEILMKRSAAKIDLTDDTNEFIIEDFISNPQRAKRCNISVFTAEINKMQLDKDIF